MIVFFVMKNIIYYLMFFLFLAYANANAAVNRKEVTTFVPEKTVKVNSDIEEIIEKTSSLVDYLNKIIKDSNYPDEISGKQMQEIIEQLYNWNNETIKTISYFFYYYSPHGNALENVLQSYHTVDRNTFEHHYTISKEKLIEIKKEICIAFDNMQKRYIDANLISAELIDFHFKKEIGISVIDLINMYKLIDENKSNQFINLWKYGISCSDLKFDISKEMDCLIFALLSERSNYASIIIKNEKKRFANEIVDYTSFLPDHLIIFNPYFNLLLKKRIIPKSKNDIILFYVEYLWEEVDIDLS